MTDENNQTDLFEDSDHDVFDDSEVEATAADNTEEVTSTENEEGGEKPAENTEDEKETDTGEKDEDSNGTPPEEKDQDGDTEVKMVPVHQLKAAVKDVNDKLEAANAEIAQLKTKPAPDPEEDPDGYNLHIKMETSKAVMRETVDDYDKVIVHYQEMAKANPQLNEAVAASPSPAKYAYDLAKRDMEINELTELRNSDEWKEFQEYRANKVKEAEEAKVKAAAQEAEQKKAPKTPAVPNLNRSTDVQSTKQPLEDEDEDLFAGAL